MKPNDSELNLLHKLYFHLFIAICGLVLIIKLLDGIQVFLMTFEYTLALELERLSHDNMDRSSIRYRPGNDRKLNAKKLAKTLLPLKELVGGR